MNKTIYHLFVLCAVVCHTVSCTKEDGLTPSGMKEDYFTVPTDATDSVSVIRRAFYEKNKVHLLFNDTLRHEQRGTYADGTPYWHTETVDLNWFLNTSTDDLVYMDYLTANYREAAGFAGQYILPHLEKELRPYSVLMAGQLYAIDSYDGPYEMDFCNGLRCLAISAGSVADMDEAAKVRFCQPIFHAVVYDKLQKMLYNDPRLDAFFAFSEGYYSVRYSEIEALKDLPSVTAEDLYPFGFISAGWRSTPSESSDLEDYAEAMFSMDEEEFKATYNHPVVHQKYDALKKIITDLGFKF